MVRSLPWHRTSRPKPGYPDKLHRVRASRPTGRRRSYSIRTPEAQCTHHPVSCERVFEPSEGGMDHWVFSTASKLR